MHVGRTRKLRFQWWIKRPGERWEVAATKPIEKEMDHGLIMVLLPADERKAIQELYLEAQYQTEKTGVEHHVDHIQPLSKGGEHLLLNLQILTADENLSKNNNFRASDAKEICKRLFDI